jgi:hypothetical protein
MTYVSLDGLIVLCDVHASVQLYFTSPQVTGAECSYAQANKESCSSFPIMKYTSVYGVQSLMLNLRQIVL